MSPSPSVAMAPAATKTNRLTFVDSLRGFAALYVLVYHMVLIPRPALQMPHRLAPLIMNGASGVTLFFLVSAFTLCLTLDGRQNRPHSTYNFYVRRLFRIVPLYYAWLVVMTIAAWGISFAAFRTHKMSFLLYALFGYNFVPGQQEGLVSASWTLGVEMVFYAFFPFLFRLVKSVKTAGFFLALSLLLACAHYLVVSAYPAWTAAGYNIYLSIFHQLPVFAVGMVVYFSWKEIQHKEVAYGLRMGVLVVGVGSFFLLPYVWNELFPHFWEQPPTPISYTMAYAMAIVYAFLFFGLSFFPLRLVINRGSVFFGLISYSLYLNHPQLVVRLQPAYYRIYGTRSLHGVSLAPVANTLHLVASFVLTAGVVTALAYATYRLVEEPTMKLAARYMKK